jgi:hypothetical protein
LENNGCQLGKRNVSKILLGKKTLQFFQFTWKKKHSTWKKKSTLLHTNKSKIIYRGIKTLKKLKV